MRFLRHQPIERKLRLIVLLSSASGLALAAALFLAYQWVLIGMDARHAARSRAELIAGNLSAALEGGDLASVSNILQSLPSQPGFHTTGAYAADANLVGALSGSQTLGGLPQTLTGGAHFDGGYAYVYRLVPTKSGRVGVIYIQSEVRPAYARFVNGLWFAVLAAGLALLVAVGVSAGMRRTVTEPIQQVWRSTHLAFGGEAAPRTASETVDELAQLAAEVNGMSDRLQAREAALQKAQNELENHVAERTRELQQEILQRRRVEAALADEKERLAVTLRSIGDGVVATDRRGHIVLFNTVAEEVTGWKSVEATGRPLREVLRLYDGKTRQPCEDPVQNVIRSDGPIELSGNIVLVARNGAERLIADSGAPIRDRDGKSIGVVLVFRDVTEKQRLAEELLKSGKLESIGAMAGGIAHDFNNILTSILGNVSLAKLQAAPESELFTALTTAEKSALRARDLTRQLLAFAKGGAPVRKTAWLGDVVKENTEFALRGSNVRSRLSVPEDLWPAEADVGQISQVIQNLVLFGVRAMPGGGTLEVRAANVTLTDPSWVPLPAGNYVMISIQDRGQGIAPEDLPRIFDPYFATKESGHGLGLSAGYAIVKRHDGHIAVESKPGRGTTFHVYLPASPTARAQPASVPARESDRVRILLMDDDPAIRDVAQAMLESLGYEVEMAQEGGEAIERFRQAQSDGRPFAAVILDLTVQGGMGGQDTVQELLRLDKNVKAIVSSGYYDDPVVARYREYGFSGTVPKPYGLEELERALKELVRIPSNGRHERN